MTKKQGGELESGAHVQSAGCKALFAGARGELDQHRRHEAVEDLPRPRSSLGVRRAYPFWFIKVYCLREPEIPQKKEIRAYSGS